VSLTAASTSESLVEAKAEASGGGSVGVGASFAINVVDNGTLAALIEDNATLSGGGDVTLSATGSHESEHTGRIGWQSAGRRGRGRFVCDHGGRQPDDGHVRQRRGVEHQRAI
jgi:hypothetical protein